MPFDALYAVARDLLIWEQHPDSDRHEREVFEAFFGDALASGGALIALGTAAGELIGSSRYHRHDEEIGGVRDGAHQDASGRKSLVFRITARALRREGLGRHGLEVGMRPR